MAHPTVSRFLKQTLAFLPEFVARLRIRRDAGPIDSVLALCGFVSTRSAFVAQKTLYGYLKARMGTRYPSMFEDDVFVASIDIAKINVFAACLSDLAVYAVSRGLRDVDVDDTARRDLAVRAFESGIAANQDQIARVPAFSAEDAKEAFERRAAFVDWRDGPSGPALFTASPAALYEWAPIAMVLKRQDKEIVQNSIRFTWRDIREQFEKRLDGPALAADLVAIWRPEP